MKCLPDDGKGGLQAYIERDKQYPDIPHEVESEGTLAELAEELGEELKAEEVDEVCARCKGGLGWPCGMGLGAPSQRSMRVCVFIFERSAARSVGW